MVPSAQRETHLVYCATSPSGKRYVGFTGKTLDERRKGHDACARKSGRRGRFHNALVKYGDAFQWEVLERVVDRDLAAEREIYHIAHFRSDDPRFGAFVLTDEVRRRMSESAKANMTPERRANLKLGRVSRPHSEETKERLRRLNTGKTLSEETRCKMSLAHTGKTHSEAHCRAKQMSQANPVLRSDGRPFISAAEAGRALGGRRDAVAKSMRRGGTCAGFTFRKIDLAEFREAVKSWAAKCVPPRIPLIRLCRPNRQ